MSKLNKTEMLELLAKHCFDQKLELEWDGEEKTVEYVTKSKLKD